VLDVAVRRLDGSIAVDLSHRVPPALPVHSALSPLLPDGLRRGSTISVGGSVSLLLALISAASAEGAWCALVGLPTISAEAAVEYGLDLHRLAIVPQPGSSWTSAVGALLDAVDIVALRQPARPVPGEVRRLAARARNRDAVLVPFQPGTATTGDTWPAADVRLSAQAGQWSGIGAGYGRLQQRRLTVTAEGRGSATRSRSSPLWLPIAGGGVGEYEPVAPVLDLTARTG
jgi:hypothetical protein